MASLLRSSKGDRRSLKWCSNLKMLVLLIIALSALLSAAEQALETDIGEAIEGVGVLSRKKRYLIFPEGSSLQLVYCLTVPTVGLRTIFTVGWTAALAWELPTEPYYKIRKAYLDAQKKSDNGTFASGGWTIQNKTTPIQSPFTYHPLPYSTIKDMFLKPMYTKVLYMTRPVKEKGIYEVRSPGKYALSKFDPSKHLPLVKPNRVSGQLPHLHPVYMETHRRTRRDLFSKIEKFFAAQQKDGKACLLKAICEVAQGSANGKGTFMEEIIRAIFRIKPYRSNDHRDNDEYDGAANEYKDCVHQYPTCSSSIWNIF